MFSKSTRPAILKKGLVMFYVLAAMVILLPANKAEAAGFVFDCNSANNIAQVGNMRFALDQAGLITFNCNGIINLQTTYIITKNTTIDGAGHSITLTGQGNHRVFIVQPGVTLTLKNLTFTSGTATTWNNVISPNGGAILNQGGNLTINNVHFNGNVAYKGGAIYNNQNGKITLQNSFFNLNSTLQGSYWHYTDGGAIYLENGTLDVTNTSFIKNTAYNGGAIANAQAYITIKDSTFNNNMTQPTVNAKVDDDGVGTSVEDATGASGGAISTARYITISNSDFAGNTASYAGGAISGAGGLITDSNFTANKAKEQNGGAIANFGTFQAYKTVFNSNEALKGEGGAIYNGNKSTVTLSQSTLKYNQAGKSGGAITSRGNYLEVRTSTLNNNAGGKLGGAIYTFSGQTILSNSTVVNNSADKGGALYAENQATVQLTNATIASDKTYASNAIYNNNGLVTLKNTIVANYLGAVNCAGSPIVDGGKNLQFPNTTCGMLTSKDPLLLALANNGGPTLTMALQIKSPAIDGGSNAVCSAGPVYDLDQRGNPRPNDGNLDNVKTCDIGAFERAALAY